MASCLLLPVEASAGDPALVGRWDPNIIEGQVPAIHMSLLHDGRILYWSGFEAHGEDAVDVEFFFHEVHKAEIRMLDLRSGTPVISQPPLPGGSDLVCVGQSILSDGRILTAGGSDWATLEQNGVYWDYVAGTYDVRVAHLDINGNVQWTQFPDMHYNRWYPTTVVLPGGDALIVSGLESVTLGNQTSVERFHAKLNDVSLYEKTWDVPIYPRLAVIPSGPRKGDVVYSPVAAWNLYSRDDVGWSSYQIFDPETGTPEVAMSSVFGARNMGASMMLPLDAANGYAGKILTFGGAVLRYGLVGSPLAEIVDVSKYPLVASIAEPMHYGRFHPIPVVLPDGNVLAIGGGALDNTSPATWGDPVPYIMEAELYNPKTGKWTVLAPMQVPRVYHGTGLLLPDGRVLVGGHVTTPNPVAAVRENVEPFHQIYETRLEIFEPPYLFRGTRPKIVKAPTTVSFKTNFLVKVDTPATIHSVMLIRAGTQTHAMELDQRAVKLSFMQAGDQIAIDAPLDGAVAPPGYYMLFVNKASSNGPIPSVASMVLVR